MTVSKVTAGPHRARRTERHIRHSLAGDFYKLSMPLRGFVLVSQDGRDAPLHPGDLAIYDTSRPYTVSCDDRCRMVVLMFPHRDLRLPASAMREMTASRVSGRQGIGGLLAPLLMNLVTRLEEVSGWQPVRLADNVVDLVATVYADRIAGTGYRPADTLQTLLLRIKTFIEQHLANPDLTPDDIAAACHISTSYLHKLFKVEGPSVSRFIRERRLEHCRRDLLDPNRRASNVSAIGAQWGLLDAAHFSRVFKAQYGESPSAYRLSHDSYGRVEAAAATIEPVTYGLAESAGHSARP